MSIFGATPAQAAEGDAHQLLRYCPPPDHGLPVVHVDEHLLVLDKPAGLLCVPGRGERMRDSLAVRAQLRYPDALVVHRLDMDTSGLVLMGRGPQAQRALSLLFMNRAVDKRYDALVDGLPAEDDGEIDLPLLTDWPRRPRQKVDEAHGKPSLTRYRVVARDPLRGCSRVSLEPVTGRSHQLRVHLAALGHPILGDPLYGDERARAAAPRLMLHAAWLGLVHPFSARPLHLASPAAF